ncbi:MAG: hypothetical protein ACUVWR_11525 [Anaerolineae bacterium]
MPQLSAQVQRHGAITTVDFSGTDHDSTWAIHWGSDGRIYVSLCSEGHATTAHLVRYDPKTDEVKDLFDVGTLANDPLTPGRVPQSKIHTCLRETSDGKLYGVTHCTAPPPGESLFEVVGTYGDPEFGYRGSYMFCYDLASEDVELVGLAIPYEGCRNMVLNEATDIAYLVSYPKHHFCTFNIKTKERRDLGRLGHLGSWDLIMDRDGRIYSSLDSGRLVRYDPTRDRLGTLAVSVPGSPRRHSPHNFLFNPFHGPDGLFYGTTYYDGYLWRYDPYDGPEGRMTDLGPGSGRDVAPDEWAAAYVQAPRLAANGNIYYGCSFIWHPCHLFSCQAQTAEKSDLGELSLGSAAVAWLSDSSTSPDGRSICFAAVTMAGRPGILIVDTEALQPGGKA